MNMQQAVKSVYKNYFNFKDRSSRSEFWYFFLFTTLVQTVLYIPALFLPRQFVMVLMFVSGLFTLGNFIPSWAVTFRRLHDVGVSAWLLVKISALIMVCSFLVRMIPSVTILRIILLGMLGSLLYLLYLYCCPSQGPNHWGHEPLSPYQ